MTNGPSPAWLQTRLKAVGLRPINALVDVTNYISQDRGRPLHVYDADKLKGAVRARLGKSGEKFLGLDGKEHAVDTSMCVIADDTGPLGLGGVIGGEASGSTDQTVNVLIESAYFDPARTAQTGRKTGLVTDARYRFERGVDPQSVLPGLDLATQMILKICGGKPSKAIVAGKVPDGRHSISLRHRTGRKVGGARSAGQRDQIDPRSARLRCPRQRRRHHRDDALAGVRIFMAPPTSSRRSCALPVSIACRRRRCRGRQASPAPC